MVASTITLLGPLGETLQDFEYDNVAPWPATPDGNGPSLEIIDPLGDPSAPGNWRASATVGGSPGAATASITGDYDGNAVVDDADRMQWRASFGLAVPPGTGADGNGDGIVDTADFVVWRKAHTSAAIAASIGVGAVVVVPQDTVPESADVEPTDTAIAIPLVDDRRPARPANRTVLDSASPAPFSDDSVLLLVELDGELVDEVLGSSPPLPDWHDDGAVVDSESAVSAADTSLAESLALWEDDAWLGSLATLG